MRMVVAPPTWVNSKRFRVGIRCPLLSAAPGAAVAAVLGYAARGDEVDMHVDLRMSAATLGAVMTGAAPATLSFLSTMAATPFALVADYATLLSALRWGGEPHRVSDLHVGLNRVRLHVNLI